MNKRRRKIQLMRRKKATSKWWGSSKIEATSREEMQTVGFDAMYKKNFFRPLAWWRGKK